jgi:hypothetical protein
MALICVGFSGDLVLLSALDARGTIAVFYAVIYVTVFELLRLRRRPCVTY